MPKRPRGTRDFGPDEMAARNEAAHRLRDVFRRFGYDEVQTPTFEELELFTAKSGAGILDELYEFEDKGGRRICLRPELTAPVMRFYFAEHAFDPKPVKWFYSSNCFRYDRPQAGRYREFWQFGCELIGAGTPLAYAELVALADACFDALGLQGRDTRIGHVGLLGARVDALGLSDEQRGQAMRLIDKDDRDGLKTLLTGAQVAAGLIDSLLALLDARDVESARGLVGDDERFQELQETLEHLDALGVEASLDLGIARGLDYYTGIVFEVHSPALGAQSQLLGGGGYDLSGVFDAQPTPTMGFGLGFDRTLVALAEEGTQLAVRDGPDVYFGALGAQAQRVVAGAVAGLRGKGLRVEQDLMGRRPGQVAKAADAAGAKRLVILGDRDLEQGEVQVKDLATGEGRGVAVDELVQELAG